MTTTAFELHTPQSRTLHGFLDLPAAGRHPAPWPVVVVCHGFKGFMEWGFFPHLAHLLAERGFAAVRFNFSGTGMKPGDERVTDLAAFRDNTYSRELEDLLAVLDALGEDGDLEDERFDLARLGLFGHSRGGAAALLAAAHRDWADAVAALVTWNAISHVDRFDEEQKSAWHRRGTSTVVNSRTGQELPMGLGMLEDVETNRLKLDLESAGGRRRAPWLLVHGRDDESVPVAEGERLAAAASGEHELLVVAGAGHTFGAVHPFAGPTPQLTEALNATQAWFRDHLSLEAQARRAAAAAGEEEAATAEVEA
jgi:pimeloyl-ACP methyl ester carboxylesterase